MPLSDYIVSRNTGFNMIRLYLIVSLHVDEHNYVPVCSQGGKMLIDHNIIKLERILICPAELPLYETVIDVKLFIRNRSFQLANFVEKNRWKANSLSVV
jgi:hypothetical protein